MKNNKTIIGAIVVVLAIVIGVIYGFHGNSGSSTASGSNSTKYGAQPEQETYWFYNGVQYGTDGASENMVPLFMGPGKNQASWQNNTGHTVFVSGFKGMFISTSTVAMLGIPPASSGIPLASSTYAFWVGTSTAPAVTDGLTEPVFGSLIDDYVLATSSLSASSNVNQFVINSTGNLGTNGKGVIPVANGQYLILVMEETYALNCGGSLCENATSTNRGFNLYGVFSISTP